MEKNYATKGDRINNPEKYVGKYKKDIVIEKDSRFVKIGESYLEIAHCDDKTIAGRYYDVFNPGFEEYANDKLDFKFDANFGQGPSNASFNVKDADGRNLNGNLFLQPMSAKIYFNIDRPRGPMMNDGEFSLMLD